MQSENLEKAVQMLRSRGLTCAFVKGEKVYISKERGVRPLLECYHGNAMEQGFSAADKVVGKAAAFLYVLLGAKEICADVVSRPALDTLHKYDIYVNYGVLADAIRNRTDTGFCPMETAVRDISDPAEALGAIEKTLARMRGETEGEKR